MSTETIESLKDEVAQLKAELKRTKEERDILKNRGVLCKGIRVRYAFIRGHRDEFSVSAMCRVMGGAPERFLRMAKGAQILSIEGECQAGTANQGGVCRKHRKLWKPPGSARIFGRTASAVARIALPGSCEPTASRHFGDTRSPDIAIPGHRSSRRISSSRISMYRDPISPRLPT